MLASGGELVGQYILIFFFIDIPELFFEGLKVLLINDTPLQTFLRIEVKRCGMVFDLFIHERLRESWLILLVVSITSKTYNVDEYILVELLSVGDCDSHAFVKNIRNIAVDVDDWSIDRLSDLGAIVRRSALFGRSSESDLVVVNNMNDTSRTVVDQILES